jgi:hypothetical protein
MIIFFLPGVTVAVLGAIYFSTFGVYLTLTNFFAFLNEILLGSIAPFIAIVAIVLSPFILLIDMVGARLAFIVIISLSIPTIGFLLRVRRKESTERNGNANLCREVELLSM